jgi:hypothetical protein
MLFYEPNLSLFFLKSELSSIKRGKRAAPAQQLGKTPLFNNLAVADNQDNVGLSNRREAVGDNKSSAASH